MSDLRMNSAGYETPAANGCDEICKLLFAEKRRKKQKFVVSLCSGLSLRKKKTTKTFNPATDLESGATEQFCPPMPDSESDAQYRFSKQVLDAVRECILMTEGR